jgi:hypothetical protein
MNPNANQLQDGHDPTAPVAFNQATRDNGRPGDGAW